MTYTSLIFSTYIPCQCSKCSEDQSVNDRYITQEPGLSAALLRTAHHRLYMSATMPDTRYLPRPKAIHPIATVSIPPTQEPHASCPKDFTVQTRKQLGNVTLRSSMWERGSTYAAGCAQEKAMLVSADGRTELLAPRD